MTNQEFWVEQHLTLWDRIKGNSFYALGGGFALDIALSMLLGRDSLSRVDVGIFCLLLPFVVWGHISATRKVQRLKKEWEDNNTTLK